MSLWKGILETLVLTGGAVYIGYFTYGFIRMAQQGGEIVMQEKNPIILGSEIVITAGITLGLSGLAVKKFWELIQESKKA